MAREFSKPLYNSKEWARVRAYCLMRDRYTCQDCGRPAEEVHHKEHLTPANIGDVGVSLNPENLVSLCKDCHFKRHSEDIAERVARMNKARLNRYMLREDGTYFDEQGIMQMRKVYLVYGSPRAGKTTYVREHMENGDCVIDLDAILAAFHLNGTRAKHDNLLWIALDVRNYLYDQLENRSRSYDCKHVWVIGGFPKRKERRELCERLGADAIYIDTPQKECENRALYTNEYGDAEYSLNVVKSWWNQFEPDPPGV